MHDRRIIRYHHCRRRSWRADCGNLRRSRGIENFIDCVKIVLKTDLYVSNQVSNTKSSFDKNLIFSLIETMESLTKRESQVLTLSLKGYSNKEIAGKMFITPKSVENYINKISNKLNLNTKKESYRNWIYNNSEVIKLIT